MRHNIEFDWGSAASEAPQILSFNLCFLLQYELMEPARILDIVPTPIIRKLETGVMILAVPESTSTSWLPRTPGMTITGFLPGP